MLLCVALPGCRNQAVSRENERLREEVLALEEQARDLLRVNQELRAELASTSSTNNLDQLAPEIREATPHLAKISLGRLSHVTDDDLDGLADSLVIYVNAVDGWSRPIQLIGSMAVSVLIVTPQGDPSSIGFAHLGPLELREAYRSGLTGSHYTIAVELVDQREPPATDQCIVRVEFFDALTGMRHTAHVALSLAPIADGDPG